MVTLNARWESPSITIIFVVICRRLPLVVDSVIEQDHPPSLDSQILLF